MSTENKTHVYTQLKVINSQSILETNPSTYKRAYLNGIMSGISWAFKPITPELASSFWFVENISRLRQKDLFLLNMISLLQNINTWMEVGQL